MKKLLVIFYLLNMTFLLHAQCNLAKDEIDDFTREKVKESQPISVVKRFMPPYYITLTLIQEGEKFFIHAKYTGEEIVETTKVTDEDYLLLRLSNGEIIELISTKNNIAFQDRQSKLVTKITSPNSETLYTISTKFKSKIEDFQALGNAKIEAVRISVNRGEKLDFKVKARAVKKIQQSAKCFVD